MANVIENPTLGCNLATWFRQVSSLSVGLKLIVSQLWRVPVGTQSMRYILFIQSDLGTGKNGSEQV
jgi:hypothetical protein